ncbi:MAG: hypothetical protein AAF513_19045 [Pseudomonadota bacterium]
MKSTILISAAALTLTGAAFDAQARSSSPSEFRGYQTCLDAADKTSNGLVPSRSYYVDKNQEDRTNAVYYINGTRWEDGERAQVRISCETAARGYRLVSSDIESGSFTNQGGRVTVEVAAQ